MTGVRFSPRRIVAVAVLSFVSAWYFGVVVTNSTPHGADQRRWEQHDQACSRVNVRCEP